MRKNFLFIFSFYILTILKISEVCPTPLLLNQTIKGYLHPKTYAYYTLHIQKIEEETSDFLLIEARRNEDQDLLDNIYSDPNLYVSNLYSEPGPSKSEWSSNRFGDEIISINKNVIRNNQIFYISIYCQFSCNYILKANLFKNFAMKENKLYTVSLIPNDAARLTFTSKKKYEKMKVNCISYKMKPFRIFLSKEDPSSTNTIQSNPIFINGYYFLIEKGDNNYAINQEYNVLIENKEFKQDLLFWISYDNEETKLDELSPLFGTIEANSENCYSFTIERHYFYKNIVLATTLFNGKGYYKNRRMGKSQRYENKIL